MDEPVTNAPRCVIPHQFMPYGCHTIVIISTASVFVPKRSPVWERPIAHRSLGPMWEAINHYRLSATVMTMGSGGVFLFRHILSTDCVLFVTY